MIRVAKNGRLTRFAIALLVTLAPISSNAIACSSGPGPAPTASASPEEAWGPDGCLYMKVFGTWVKELLCRTYPIAGTTQVVKYYVAGAPEFPIAQYDTRTPGQVVIYDFSSNLKTMYYTKDPNSLYVASDGQWVPLGIYLGRLQQAQLRKYQQQFQEQQEKLQPKNPPTPPATVSASEALTMAEESRNRMTEIILAPPCTYSHNGCAP
ncbi:MULTISPECIES: hypothetical protein [unclassified Streptomyces]|uniref:hypothetical protein n=1 Tax=unclassified Streptomyces TaxID=2593676 RepID=UPI0036E70A51